MAPKPRPKSASSGLTEGQTRLLDRHRRGILRLASTLGAKSGVRPDDLMFVLAGRQSNMASVVRELFPGVLAERDAVVVPGLAKELTKWIERLAVSGPVWDCTTSSAGLPVIVIDAANTMALIRIAP
jgi:hypothetical protein